jgi:FKBP-type peptidyl-prolyl cis-trans isomerase FkpA
VKTTASGLQYKVLRDGNGKQPKSSDVVEVHYEGRLIEGTVFDSSYQRRESIEFPLNGVIAGWTEGVALMKEGAKYQFYIPAELAYGSDGAGGDIGPDETLIFDVELIKVR